MTTCIQVQLQIRTTQVTLHNQTIEFRTNKENRLDTAVGVATGSGRGHEPINNNLNTTSGLISCLSQGNDNIWSSLEQS